MTESQRLARAAAIHAANTALEEGCLPTYDELVAELRDARSLMAHYNVPAALCRDLDDKVASVQAVADQADGVRDAWGPDTVGKCDTCGHDLDDVSFGCRDCL